MPAGRVWKFGDDINTDLMLPGPLLTASEAEQARAVFSANRPGWIDQIAPGDIIVGGRNFGTGSSRRRPGRCAISGSAHCWPSQSMGCSSAMRSASVFSRSTEPPST